MATENLLEKLQKEAAGGTVVLEAKKKAEQMKQANQDFLQSYKSGTERVLQGQERTQQQKMDCEGAMAQGKQYVAYVAKTVDGLTSEFAAVDEYLGNVTNFQGEEAKLVRRCSTPIVSWFVDKEKTMKQAENMRTERILRTSLAQNTQTILDYYATMKQVLYNSAIDNQRAVNEVRAVREETVRKLNESDRKYNELQAQRKEAQAKLAVVEGDLLTLTGEKKAQKEQERIGLAARVSDLQTAEDLEFSVVKNATEDMRYQDQHVQIYEEIVRGLTLTIQDMQQKIENRTVMFKNIETVIKTTYRVKSAAQADAAVNKTMAEATKTGIQQKEAIMAELGRRSRATPMSPEEFEEWRSRNRAIDAAFEADIQASKDRYATPDVVPAAN